LGLTASLNPMGRSTLAGIGADQIGHIHLRFFAGAPSALAIAVKSPGFLAVFANGTHPAYIVLADVDGAFRVKQLVRSNKGSFAMLYWAATFLVIALIAAVLGFGGLAAGAAEIAKILFVVFLVLFIVSLIFGGLRRGPTV
jgi:uncharacterized membrane protein YtjA (UPF0391 family)